MNTITHYTLTIGDRMDIEAAINAYQIGAAEIIRQAKTELDKDRTIANAALDMCSLTNKLRQLLENLENDFDKVAES